MMASIVAALFIIAGLFLLTDVRPGDMTDELKKPFEHQISRARRIRHITGKKPRAMQRMMEEAVSMLDASGKGEQVATYRNMPILLAIAGFLFGLLIDNILAGIVLCIGLAVTPLTIIRLRTAEYNRMVNEKLEMAMSSVTNSYVATGNLLTAVERTLPMLPAPVNDIFKRFAVDMQYLDGNAVRAIQRMRDSSDNWYWQEWCNALIQCQDDVSLNRTLEGNLEGGMEPANWVDVLAVYSVHLTMRENNAMDVIQLDKTKVQELRNVFWDMNRLSTETDTDENGETVRYILGTSRNYLEMADEYHFTDQQRQMLAELMSDDYYAFWSNFVSESMGYAPDDWTGITDVGDYVPSMSGSVMNIPKLYQFDYRKTVCVIDGKRKSVSTSGCGATSMSMVIRYLTGNTNQTPYTLFKWAYDNGHYSGDGLGHGTVSKMGELYGVTGSWVGKDGKKIVAALQSGHPVIAHMGPGVFTKQGHYIVLRGVTDDGKILVNDPNSKSRSGKAYPLSTILSQSKTSEPFMICSATKN